jgi:hypothetical protein
MLVIGGANTVTGAVIGVLLACRLGKQENYR